LGVVVGGVVGVVVVVVMGDLAFLHNRDNKPW